MVAWCNHMHLLQSCPRLDVVCQWDQLVVGYYQASLGCLNAEK